MSNLRKYPFDGRILVISEQQGELVCALEDAKTGIEIACLVSPRSELEMGLFDTRARLATHDARFGIPLPLYLGQIIAQEWRITRIEYPSYLMRGSMLLPVLEVDVELKAGTGTPLDTCLCDECLSTRPAVQMLLPEVCA